MDALAGYASSEEEEHHSGQEIAETKLEKQKTEKNEEIEGLTNAQDHTGKEDVDGPPKTGNNKATARPDSLNLPTTSGLFASLPAPSSKRLHLISQKPLIMETYSSDEEVDDVKKKDGPKRRKIANRQHVVARFNDEEEAIPGAAAAGGNELYRVDVGPMPPPPVSVAGASLNDHHQPTLSPVEAFLKQQFKDTAIQYTEVSATTLRGTAVPPPVNVEPEYIEKLRRETAAMEGGRGAVGKSIHALYKMAKVQELEEYDWWFCMYIYRYIYIWICLRKESYVTKEEKYGSQVNERMSDRKGRRESVVQGCSGEWCANIQSQHWGSVYDGSR